MQARTKRQDDEKNTLVIWIIYQSQAAHGVMGDDEDRGGRGEEKEEASKHWQLVS